MPRPGDGGALEGLQSICAGADLQSDLVGAFPVGGHLAMLPFTGDTLRAAKHKIADLDGLNPDCAIV